VHLPVSAPHLPALHVPALHLSGRLPVATVLLSAVYALAVAVALTAPGQHALAGCVVLAGLVSRSVVRRRTATAALPAATAAVDSIAAMPDEAVAPAPATTA
jgi:CHAT domain-containing protein